MPPNLAPPSAAPGVHPPTADARSSSPPVQPSARGADNSWPIYEVSEQDLTTFLDVPAALSATHGAKLDGHRVRALLDPIVHGDAGAGGRLVVERRYFTVRRDGTPAGRLVAHLLAPHVGGPPVSERGFFGLLAAEPDPDAVRFLFDMASDWLGGRGCRTLIGNVRPDQDTGADTWISGGIDEVAPALLPCLHEVGLEVEVGASTYACPVPSESGLRRLVPDRGPPDGVAWTPLHPRAPWRGIQGTLAGDQVAAAECERSGERPEQAWRRFMDRIRGVPPTGPVQLRRFEVHSRLRDRGIGAWMARELLAALGRAGVPSLLVGPLHDGHVAARRLLHRASARRVRRIPMYTLDL